MNQTENEQQNTPSSELGFYHSISDLLGKIGGFATLFMVILVTFNVITRALFNWSILGFYEILGLTGAVFYSFGIVYAATQGQHIVMDMVVNRLPHRIRQVCGIISRVVVLIFCGVLIYAGVEIALDMLDEKTYYLKIPVAPFRFVAIIAFVMLAILMLTGKSITKGGEE